MDKLLILLMIILFGVAVTNQTIFADEGLQNDAAEMKSSTQSIVQQANTTMKNFGNN